MWVVFLLISVGLVGVFRKVWRILHQQPAQEAGWMSEEECEPVEEYAELYDYEEDSCDDEEDFEDEEDAYGYRYDEEPEPMEDYESELYEQGGGYEDYAREEYGDDRW